MSVESHLYFYFNDFTQVSRLKTILCLIFFRLYQNQFLNPIWSIQRFLPTYFLRNLKFFIIPFIMCPLTTYKIFYIGPAQWLVTFLVSPKSFLSPFHTIFDSMRKAFLTFWGTWATMFSRCLITLFVNEFHLSLEDNLPKQCKVKNSLTFHVQPLYNFI